MSVVSRMLQDLESRGARIPLDRPVAQAVDAPPEPSPRSWRVTALLSAGLLACGAAVYGAQAAGAFDEWLDAWRDEPAAVPAWKTSATPQSPRWQSASPSATGGATAIAASQAEAEPNWRMDWALSLGLLKHRPTRVALSPQPDLGDETGDAPQEVTGGEPPVVQAQAAPVVAMPSSRLTLIDPPAAGRMQSAANQAIEAYRRAIDLAEQGRDGVALDAALQAIKLDAHHMPARRLAIALALDQKQADQAGALIDQGLQLAPQDSELLFLHARRLALSGANDQALNVLQGLDHLTGEAWGLKAGLLARTGQYAPAAQAYQQALKTRPDNATWWLGLGVAFNAQGQTAIAKEAFLRARKLGQLSPDVQAWLDQQL
ncbi:MAG: tetratricopeptide repeat protein [Acidobacteriota bacterium]